MNTETVFTQDISAAISAQPILAVRGISHRPSRLLNLGMAAEPVWKRRLYLILGLAIATGFFFTVHTYFAPGPGNPGIDENAYLVAGKNVVRHFSPGFRPADDFAYVGPMWIRTNAGWFYPKYPAGIPLLNALAIWLGGGHNNAIAFYTSPVCATLAIVAMFLLVRAIAGSFLAMLGALILATNATMLQLALVPSSHAPAICFALWGMFGLICWWSTGKIWVGIATGLLLGYAVTIRYTEGLLAAPLGIAAISTIRWTRWRSYFRAAVPVLAWALPVAALVIFNRITTGHYTGYDSTHESGGFTLAEFKTKWEYTVQELYLYGLFFLLPLGVLGMLLMFARNWRLGLTMVLWFVPAALLYTAYYWGAQTPGVGYLRFFLTLYPPIIASSLWLLSIAAKGLMSPTHIASDIPRPRVGSVAIPIAAGILTAAVAAAGIYVALPDMERQHIYNENLAFSAEAFLKAVPAARFGSGKPLPLLFADDAGMFSRLLMYMQFVGDGDWYSTGAFTPRGGRGLGAMGRRPPGGAAQADPDQPVLFDPQRSDFLKDLYGKMTASDLSREETRVVNSAIEAGRPVYAILSVQTADEFRRRLSDEGFDCVKIASWKEPIGPEIPSDTSTASPRGGPNGNNRFNGGAFRGGAGRGGRGAPAGAGRFPPGGVPDTGALSPPARNMRLDNEAQTLQVFQITRKSPPAPRG